MLFEDARRGVSSKVRTLSLTTERRPNFTCGAMHADRGRGDGAKSKRPVSRPLRTFWDRVPGSALYRLHIGRLRALLTLGHLELDLLALGERLEAISRDAGEVDEDVLSSFARDEAVALLVAEPLNGPAQNVSLLPVPREAVSLRWVRPGKRRGRGSRGPTSCAEP
jgi:hypothetical protein